MKHKLIKTDNYLLVVDNDLEINDVRPYIGRWHLEKGHILNKFPTYLTDLSECKLVLTHLPLNGAPYLHGVDVLPLTDNGEKDDVDKLAREEILYNDNKREWWKQGYNKAREKYKFTEEDMRKAIIMSSLSSVDIQDNRCDVIIKSLQQPKIPIAFECEKYLCFPSHCFRDCEIVCKYPRPKTITNSEGRIEWVGKYIY